MIIHEAPQSSVHKTTVPHPLSPGEPVYATNWGSFPSRHRTHIHTMRARSAIVSRRYQCPESSRQRPESARERSAKARPSQDGPSMRSSFPPHTLEEIHRAKMGELPFVATCHRYPLSAQRPASAAVSRVSRLNSAHTAASRARSAGPGGHEVRGRAGGHGGYSWVTLSLFSDSKRALYDTDGALKGSKRTNVK